MLKWNRLNEDPSKMNLGDFFKNETFDFYEVYNFLGFNLFEKCKIFFERNSFTKNAHKPENGKLKKQFENFDDRIYGQQLEFKKQNQLNEKLEEIKRLLLGREIQVKNDFIKQGKPEMINF